MSGSVGLSTPWARQSITRPDREMVEAAMPDHWTLGVSVDKNRGHWVFWTINPDGEISHQLRVSASMSLRSACFYALHHWKLDRGMAVTTDGEGWIRSITDADELGPLVAALAKAQGQFAPVVRDKTVTVTTKTGSQYTFKYAPLEAILAAVRGPLADNGLAIVQMLDDGTLETSLMHESGAVITGRVTLPNDTNIQGLGSAITYLRRYAIQAMLAIAAEEDDDGNSAAGNLAVPKSVQVLTAGVVADRDPGGITGTAEIGTAKDSDFQLRETPDGWALGFRLVSDKGGIKVIARDAMAQALAASIGETVGKRITVWGRIRDEEFTNKGGRKIKYQVLEVERIRAPEYELPAQDFGQQTIAEASPLPLPLEEPHEMPDTLTQQDLAAIRKGAWRDKAHHGGDACEHVRALLAHIDALTAALPELVAVAIANLPNGGGVTYYEALGAGHRIAAILRGEQ